MRQAKEGAHNFHAQSRELSSARTHETEEEEEEGVQTHGCQMAKFDPFLSLDCARVEGVGAQSKERKGSNFAA